MIWVCTYCILFLPVNYIGDMAPFQLCRRHMYLMKINVYQIWWIRRVSGITFNRYARRQIIEVFKSKITKEPKYDSQYRCCSFLHFWLSSFKYMIVLWILLFNISMGGDFFFHHSWLVSGFVTAYPYCYDFSNGAIMTICQLIDGQ